MLRISVEEAGEKLAVLVAAVQGGEDVILLLNNIAVARLVPDDNREPPEKKRQLGTAGPIWMADDFDAIPEGFEDYL